MRFRDQLMAAVLVFSAAILPFFFEPARIAPHESHRAGLLALLIVVAIPGFQSTLGSLNRAGALFLLALVGWILALVLSSILALSPSRALAGDLQRHMGLWTQLVLIAGLFLTRRFGYRPLWRWFWLAGVVVAVHAILDATTVVRFADDRPRGLFGWPTFTAGWLMLATLWAGAGFVNEGIRRYPTWRRLVFGAGLLLMPAGIFFLGARSAALGLFVGVITAGLLWTAFYHRRELTIGLLSAGALAVIVVAVLSQTVVDGPAASSGNLFARTNLNEFDLFRRVLWDDARIIVSEWPELADIDGQPDRWGTLRPLVGYGLEMFEPAHRLIDEGVLPIPADFRVDRAHNIWYDVLINAGWFGLLARLALWTAAWWLALTRLRLQGRGALALLAAGAVIGIAASWNTQFVPIAGTFGALAGSGLWLIWCSVRGEQRGDDVHFDQNAWLALALLTAHLVEAQFGFDTIATSWMMWLGLGLLFTPQTTLMDTESPLEIKPAQIWAWVGISGGLLLKTLPNLTPDIAPGNVAIGTPGIIVLLLTTVAAGWFIAPATRFLLIGGAALLWGVGWLAGQTYPPEVVAVWNLVLVSGGVVLLVAARGGIRREQLTLPLGIPSAYILILAAFLWGSDITSGAYFRRGDESFDPAAGSTDLETAGRLRPWDDRLLSSAGLMSLNVGLFQENPERVNLAEAELQRARNLNRFDAVHALRLASLETNLIALDAESAARHVEQADLYYQSAARLWPTQTAIWREWGRFALAIEQDPILARERVTQALNLNPRDFGAQRLLEELDALEADGGG